MTKKHFEAIAKTIKMELAYTEEVNKPGVKQLAQCLAAQFREFNGAFDKDRFLKACGIGQ